MASNIQREFREIEEGSSSQAVETLVKNIEEMLPDFPKSREFETVLAKKTNENQHSTALCLYLNNKLKSKYCFMKENAQIGSYTVDLSVYYHGCDLLFNIEAKILPTPKKGKKSTRIEHEYVYGKGAGIQRFKDGFHGVDNNNNYLSINGMIAYIKENDFDYWFCKVNNWILEAQWGKSEQLKKIYFKSIAKLVSNHTRLNAPDVSLFHFWIIC